MKTLKLNLLEKKEMNEVRGGKAACNPNPDCPYNCQTKNIHPYIERWKMSRSAHISLVAPAPQR